MKSRKTRLRVVGGRQSASCRTDGIKTLRLENLIAVLECPNDVQSIGAAIRNASGFGLDKVYIVDPRGMMPDAWEEIRQDRLLNRFSDYAVQWTVVNCFRSTEDCLAYLEEERFKSIVASPYCVGGKNVVLPEGTYLDPRLAVWFCGGYEGASRLLMERSEYCVTVPLFGMVDHLNVNVSTGVVLYEITKQRREYARRFVR